MCYEGIAEGRAYDDEAHSIVCSDMEQFPRDGREIEQGAKQGSLCGSLSAHSIRLQC
jgi:hypothetical protein